MGLDKKQKKQLEAAKKKLVKLRQQLAGARQQNDDPAEIPRLKQEVDTVEQQIHDIKSK